MSSSPEENFEPRQTATSENYNPDPFKSLPLSPARQALVDDIIALYSCQPMVEWVKRYTLDYMYDDQFRSWAFLIIPKAATMTSLVSLALDPDTVNSDSIQVKYHKDQANDKDYSHEGLGFTFKKWQADQVAKHIDSPEIKDFEAED